MDSGRKDMTDKVSDKMTPQDSKSTLDKAKDYATGTGDKVARDVQPDSQKGTMQSASDKMSREKDSHTGDKSMMDKAKDTVGLGDKH